jgi:acetolactate synthase-1/3 small subunit
MKEKYILYLLVKDRAGVLAKVCSIFGRRNYNIEGITACFTNIPGTTRMTIVVSGDEKIMSQLMCQIEKLEETIHVDYIPEKDAYCKEILFVKVRVDEKAEVNVRVVAALYNARIIEENDSHITFEVTDTTTRIDGFLKAMKKYNIVEMCRSGVAAILHGYNN